MLVKTCGKCKKEIEVKEDMPVNLVCPYCGIIYRSSRQGSISYCGSGFDCFGECWCFQFQKSAF